MFENLEDGVDGVTSDEDNVSDSVSDIDSSFLSLDSDTSVYVPTPQKKKFATKIVFPNKLCFVELHQVEKFVQQLNSIRCCSTLGCKGVLFPETVKLNSLGGAVSICYSCNGCTVQRALFESCLRDNDSNKVSMSVQVAFIIAGCTHATYYKALKQALGIEAVSANTFMTTIVKMYPVVKQMVNEMCEDGKNQMKCMDPTQLGSWSRAVTSADGMWMTRGFHSKNATFSMRNYLTGALLYYVHLCQRGRDKVIHEELLNYQGTSKAAEGYGARLVSKKAKEEGMNIEVHWQDADSSSSNAVQEHFNDAEVMICGGHVGRAHMKQLEKFAKMKSFSEDFQHKHREKFQRSIVCPVIVKTSTEMTVAVSQMLS